MMACTSMTENMKVMSSIKGLESDNGGGRPAAGDNVRQLVVGTGQNLQKAVEPLIPNLHFYF